MAVKVLIVLSGVLFCLAQADVSHLNLTALNSNKESVDAKIKDTKIEQKSPRLQSRQAVLETATKAHEGYGYIYRKPSIPFVTGNQVHQGYDYPKPEKGYEYPKPEKGFEYPKTEKGYDYPKPANPMTYPPPTQSPTATEPTFPDATARLRAK